MLDSADQARIGSILYISPGAFGQIAVIPGKTTIVTASDDKDSGATALKSFPPGVPVIKSGCGHTGLACLFSAAQNQSIAIGNNSSCQSPIVNTLASEVVVPGHGSSVAEQSGQ